MYLGGRQDYVPAGETATWLERTDARVGMYRDRTVRFRTARWRCMLKEQTGGHSASLLRYMIKDESQDIK